MTQIEFEELEQSIENEQFLDGCIDPITYGIARAAFDQQKYRRLIAAAQQAEADFKTAWNKLQDWNSRLEKATRSRARLERLRNELRPQLGFMSPRSTGSLEAFHACQKADCGSD